MKLIAGVHPKPKPREIDENTYLEYLTFAECADHGMGHCQELTEDGIMGEFFKGWRRRSGLLTLIVALVFAGAWFKSSFDKRVICCLNGSRVDELPMAGKIKVSYSNNRNVEIMGFYRESIVLALPHQPDTESPRQAPTRDAVDFSFEVPPPSAMLEDTEVMPVSYQTVASNAEESSSSESWNQSDAKPTQVGKPIGINVDFDKQIVSDTDGNTYAMDSELAKELAEGEDEDEGLTTSKWQGFGFYANWTKSPNGSWYTNFHVPHGSIVIPLMLLSAYLILSKPRSANLKKDGYTNLDSSIVKSLS